MKMRFFWLFLCALSILGCACSGPPQSGQLALQDLPTDRLLTAEHSGDLEGLRITVERAWQLSPENSQKLQDALNAWLEARQQKTDSLLANLDGDTFLVLQVQVRNEARSQTPTFFLQFTLQSQAELLGLSTFDALLYLPLVLEGNAPWWLEVARGRLEQGPAEKRDKAPFELGRAEYHSFSLIPIPLGKGEQLTFRIAWRIPSKSSGLSLSYTETGFRDRVSIPLGDSKY